MAEQKKDENVNRVFENIRFEKVEDGYIVKVDYDAHSESLSLQFVNDTTKYIFEGKFDKGKLRQITDQVNVPPALVVKMIIDTLQSKQSCSKNIRLFIVANKHEGMCYIYCISYIL